MWRGKPQRGGEAAGRGGSIGCCRCVFVCVRARARAVGAKTKTKSRERGGRGAGVTGVSREEKEGVDGETGPGHMRACKRYKK